eukprot:751718_1
MAETESERNHLNNSVQRRLSDIVHYDDMYWFQKILYYLIYPVLWVLDLRCIRKREWIQLPLLTYTIEITQIIIALSLVKLCTDHIHSVALTSLYLSIYLSLGSIICLAFLYYVSPYTTPLHYHCFVDVSTYIIAYGILYLTVHIQHHHFSTSIAWSWIWFAIVYVIAHAVIAIIILLKQIAFDVPMTDDSQYLRYRTFYQVSDPQHDLETSSLIEDDPDAHRSNALIDLREHQIEEIETDRFSVTVCGIFTNIWSIALGFLLIECIIYSLVGVYIMLLITWKGENTQILQNIWYMIVIGIVLAVLTVFIESVMDIYCKAKCYSNNNDDKCVLFGLSFLNQIGLTWSQILAAAIGWAILPPNQSENVYDRLRSALIGTAVAICIGVFGQRIKFKKEKKLLQEMDEIRNDEYELYPQRKLKAKTQKLILYDRLIKIYNAALAIGVSFAWDSFEGEVIEQEYQDTKADMMKAISAAVSVILYVQFELELFDLRHERLKNAIKASD